MEVLGARKGLVDWLISLQDGHLGSLLAYWFIRGPSNVISTDLFGGIAGGHFSKKESSCYRSYAWPANTTKPSGFGDCSGGFDFHRALVYTTGMSLSL